MPTIPQLPGAAAVGPQDEVPLSQSGITREVSVAELLSGTQPLLQIPSQVLLGRSSLGPGSPEALSPGAGLVVQNGAVSANGGDHAGFVQEAAFGPADEVIVNASGTPSRLPVTALRALFAGGQNVAVSTAGVISASTDSSVTGSLTSLSQALTAANASITTLASKIPAGGIAGLNAQGQVTAPIAGDVSLGTVQVAGSGTARALARRATDRLNLLDFGAVTGGADCTAAFNAAIAALPAGAGEIYLPPGDFWLQSPITINGRAISIRGAGRGISRLHFQHTGIGIDIAPGTVLNKVRVAGLSLIAESNAGQTAAALRVTYPTSVSFGYVTTVLDDLEIQSYPNAANGTAPFPQTFQRGMILIGCWSSQLSRISWFGPPSAAGATSSAMLELNETFDTRLQSVQAYYGNAFVLQSGYCEGIYIENPLAVGVDYFVLQTDITKWPTYTLSKPALLGLWVASGEVNSTLGTMQLKQVTDLFVSGVDITRDSGPNTAQVLFNLTDVSNMHVSGCNFVGGPSGGNSNDIAFSFRSVYNSSSNIIDGCHFEDMATVIQVNWSNGTVGLTTYGLHLGNVPLSTAIQDGSAAASGNGLSFLTPAQNGLPAGLGSSQDLVYCNVCGSPLFRINNVQGAANYLRSQAATTTNPPTLCFDGSDGAVNGVIQTKGGNLYVNAAGSSGNPGNLLTLLNQTGASNCIVLQNAVSGNLSLMTTNTGGLGIQPKGALWLSPSGGIFVPGLPTTRPAAGSGQVWNNAGVLSIA